MYICMYICMYVCMGNFLIELYPIYFLGRVRGKCDGRLQNCTLRDIVPYAEIAETAYVNICRYVCRHARMQTDILTRIKIYTYHEQYADGYERGLVLHKYLVRSETRVCSINP